MVNFSLTPEQRRAVTRCRRTRNAPTRALLDELARFRTCGMLAGLFAVERLTVERWMVDYGLVRNKTAYFAGNGTSQAARMARQARDLLAAGGTTRLRLNARPGQGRAPEVQNT